MGAGYIVRGPRLNLLGEDGLDRIPGVRIGVLKLLNDNTFVIIAVESLTAYLMW
jgi:hypothetical protein